MRLAVSTICVALSAAVPALAQTAPTPASAPAVGGAGELFKPATLFQTWAFYERAAPRDCLDEDCVTNRSTLRVRRAELSFSGEVVPETIGYKVMLDLARATEMQDATLKVQPEGTVKAKQPTGPVTIFQDLFLNLRAAGFELSAGQFKIPVSLEAYGVSSSKLLFPERSIVAREFGDKRDVGLKLSRRMGIAQLTAAVYNGAGQNLVDGNNAKDAALRLEFYPWKGVTFALASYDTVGERNLVGTRDRWEADLRLERGPLLLHGELIRARDRIASGEDGVVHSWGATAAAAYTFAERIQAALRYSRLDPRLGYDLDPAASNGVDEVDAVEAGVNYLFSKHQAKLQLAYSALIYEQRPETHQVVLAAQAGF